MEKFAAIIFSLSLLVSASGYKSHALANESNSNSQTITRSGSQASYKGAAEYFTGNVRIDPLFSENDSAQYTGGYVTFQPGARSAWHTHPKGQRLIVTEGIGWIQEWGGPIEEIREGDVIWCPPGVKHWHGASPTTSMTHIALTGVHDGQNVEWLEKVSDEQYGMKDEEQKKEKLKNETKALNAKQENIVTIAAFTAEGDLPKLKIALNEGLNAGLTVNDIKEILVQLYAYAGFPRSLNGITALMDVLEEREAKGIKDEIGKEASPLPSDKSSIELGTEIQTSLAGRPVTGAVYEFVPVMDEFLKGHLFGDIFGRDNLDFQSREIATIAALANMEGVNSQLQAHFSIGSNVGLTEHQMRGIISVLKAEVGNKEANNAAGVLDNFISTKEK
ncbi:(R)-mandelonitrile lyase [Metabacillus sp. Hm71]|uniref:(R)-mandelonitrile lyase n=1 Tax=Metabacillus sp. Hm71 TaxID=3450743 RepID=UPI003F43BDE4